jgi:hypothetical protein
VPAAHAEHVVRAELTTDGAEQSVHWMPNAEEVVPTHAMQSVRFVFGASPGAQIVHVVPAPLTTFGAWQSEHDVPAIDENFPISHERQLDWFELACSPGGQAVHTDSPVWLKCSAGQASQLD